MGRRWKLLWSFDDTDMMAILYRGSTTFEQADMDSPHDCWDYKKEKIMGIRKLEELFCPLNAPERPRLQSLAFEEEGTMAYATRGLTRGRNPLDGV